MDQMNQLKRIVHLDLKGAPLKISYLEKVLLNAKSWGATGFLLEWEDTFPYQGDLEVIGSLKDSGGDGMYTMQEVLHIFDFGRKHGLEAIQLVQTIGHLEFVLKHPTFRGLREVPISPAVLCPSKDASRELVMKMVEQALDAQPDAQYFHIGADEVWHRGQCPECQWKYLGNEFREDGLFLEYIQNLTSFIKKKRPLLTVLMWDDMLRSINENAIKAYDLSNVQPVYWNYNQIENFHTEFALWQKYSKLFPKLWAGSAFKGANGSCQLVSPVSRYVSNHDAWLREYTIYKECIGFVGIILTGWSRYDHYATLCELMPVMLPSLASCLRVLTKSNTVSRDKLVNDILPSHEWPGEVIARCINTFVVLRERCYNLLRGDQVNTWLNPWQAEYSYTVCLHVQNIASNAKQLLDELDNVSSIMTAGFSTITGPRSTEEWLGTNIVPLHAKVTELFNMADGAMTRDAGVKPDKDLKKEP